MESPQPNSSPTSTNTPIPLNPLPSPQPSNSASTPPLSLPAPKSFPAKKAIKFFVAISAFSIIFACVYLVYLKFFLTPKIFSDSPNSPTPSSFSSSLTPSNTSDSNPTADWQTYTVSGFSFSYPSSFNLSDYGGEGQSGQFGGARIKFWSLEKTLDQSDSKIQINFSLEENTQKKTLDSLLECTKYNLTCSHVTYGNIDFFSNSTPPEISFNSTNLVNISNNQIIYIAITTPKSLSPGEQSTINQLLSTFKFTNDSQVDISTWKTFKAKDFFIKFPTGWVVSESPESQAGMSAQINIYNPSTMEEQCGNGGCSGLQVPTEQLEIYGFLSTQTPKEYVDSILEADHSTSDALKAKFIQDRKSTIINGFSVEEYPDVGEGSNGDNYVFSNGSTIILIHQLWANTTTTNQILSTFQFTN